MKRKSYSYIILFVCLSHILYGQDSLKLRFFEPADEFHPKRFWYSAGAGALAYTGVMIGLNELWYADFPRTSFQFFDDSREWKGMDKAGHAFTAYFESSWAFQGAMWTGIPRRKSMWIGVGLGSLFQASIETLDGFSAEWGFSVADIAANTAGVGLFAAQELIWSEQRILLKVSSHPNTYSDELLQSMDGTHLMPLSERADELFGGSYPATFLKDYNRMTVWASFNIKSFTRNNAPSWLPGWLNIAVGYGAENLYGGFENKWIVEDQEYELSGEKYPRYHQFFISFDADFSRIKSRKPFVRTLLAVLNAIKIPGPALEINAQNGFRFRSFYF